MPAFLFDAATRGLVASPEVLCCAKFPLRREMSGLSRVSKCIIPGDRATYVSVLKRSEIRENLDAKGVSKLLRAIIFDFDGIIVNSEPLIMRLTQQMAVQAGYQLSEAEYYHKFLALDDRGIAEHIFLCLGHPVDHARCQQLVEWKKHAYMEAIKDGLPPFPDAIEFVRRMAAQYPLAIASGSLRAEIEYLLGKIGLRDQFKLLVTADDVARSKPDPEVFLLALTRLRQMVFNAENNHAPLQPSECLVIEDAAAGVDAAHSAGMKCMALAHSLPLDVIGHAEWVYDNFGQVEFGKILADFLE